MKRFFQFLFQILFPYHLFICFIIVLIVLLVLPIQIKDRSHFANTELYKDVIERWGAPIVQSAPSVRYIETGTVFTELYPLPFANQTITINTLMNYRKRGLVYFSGFDFNFKGNYTIVNSQAAKIDIVFVFPINLEKNKILLSNLNFYVDEKPSTIDLSETRDKLVWTGRLEKEQAINFEITYSGRGLNEFNYVLDPDLPVKNFHLTAFIEGGKNYDYAEGVIPATAITMENKDKIIMEWDYTSLESGVPVGLILPSEKSFDKIITTMTQRSWLTFIFFFLGIIGLFFYAKKPLPLYTACLIAASYSFFFVLLAYLAAYLHFYIAYGIAFVVIALMLFLYINYTLSLKEGLFTAGLFIIYQFIPTCAVILEGHTGLIYTLEILLGLCILMWLSSRNKIQALISTFKTTLIQKKELS
ncbi:MAG: hypothetical protein JXB88_02530 [Spirochaetales bacterium]|nr:hypothetical protein [Spirochaetales bacterium]